MAGLKNLFNRFRSHPADNARDRASINSAEQTWIVVGLGNPGERYRRTRHNLGFMVIDRLAAKHGGGAGTTKFEARVVEIRLDEGQRVLLVQPQTFYNETGRSAAALARYFKVPLERLIVVHDDLDLEPGRVQVLARGGHAGNRGVRSLQETFASSEFVRVRVGIGRPMAGQDPVEFVLYHLSESELAGMQDVIERAGAAVEMIIAQGVVAAMNLFNRRT
jgi:PTH1 family peptidyl-tRNA hydrolase